MPRLHRILSSLYVPNYFIGRTRTADGLLGDPVNVALRGSEAQLHQAMIDAGWTIADENHRSVSLENYLFYADWQELRLSSCIIVIPVWSP